MTCTAGDDANHSKAVNQGVRCDRRHSGHGRLGRDPPMKMRGQNGFKMRKLPSAEARVR